MNKNGVTIIELLVTTIVGGLMILTMWSVSEIGSISHQKLLLETQIYNDIAYGFKLVQNKVHPEKTKLESTPITGGSTTWKDGTERLDVGSSISFGVYNEAGGESFVYSLGGNRHTLLEADTMNMTLDPPILTDEVEIVLSGTKDGIAFSRTMKVKGRRL